MDVHGGPYIAHLRVFTVGQGHTTGLYKIQVFAQRGVAAEMVLYSRSGHVPHEPKLQMNVTPCMIDWFDEHLGRGSESDSSTAASGE